VGAAIIPSLVMGPVTCCKVAHVYVSYGFHRVYALRALGVKEIPVVVQISNKACWNFIQPGWPRLANTVQCPGLCDEKISLAPSLVMQYKMKKKVKP